jgi:hypothetical protein
MQAEKGLTEQWGMEKFAIQKSTLLLIYQNFPTGK